MEKSIIITTAPKSEYEFTDWTVIDGDINIKNKWLNHYRYPVGSTSTITAIFIQSTRSITINFDRFYNSTSITSSDKNVNT